MSGIDKNQEKIKKKGVKYMKTISKNVEKLSAILENINRMNLGVTNKVLSDKQKEELSNKQFTIQQYLSFLDGRIIEMQKVLEEGNITPKELEKFKSFSEASKKILSEKKITGKN